MPKRPTEDVWCLAQGRASRESLWHLCDEHAKHKGPHLCRCGVSWTPFNEQADAESDSAA